MARSLGALAALEEDLDLISVSPPSVIPVPGDPTPPFGFLTHRALVWGTYTHGGEHSYLQNKKNYIFKTEKMQSGSLRAEKGLEVHFGEFLGAGA